MLTSRVVDCPIRPLFPKDMRNDVSVVMTVMSVTRTSPESRACRHVHCASIDIP
ncbi:MAG: hypothetical protein ACLR7U_14380 [Ruthenibacterium lactatiformans]